MTSAAGFSLRLRLTTDWGVSTGIGLAGGVDAAVEKDSQGRPVIRGTVIAGIMREQAFNAAHALDNASPTGPWQDLAGALFGNDRAPRLVSFSDAAVTPAGQRTDPSGSDSPGAGAPPRTGTHEVMSVSIDDDTGTALPDHLRLIERAAGGEGRSTVTLHIDGASGAQLAWTPAQVRAACLILALAAQLVSAIGSDRTSGDGRCRATLMEGNTALDRHWCANNLDALQLGASGVDPTVPKAASHRPARLSKAAGSRLPQGEGATAPLRIRLDTPLVAYEVPFSNEVKSLEFLRGTVLLSWVHRRLRGALPDNALVRDAVVLGHLELSDATPVIGGVRGLPVPFILSKEKNAPATGNGEGFQALNRMLAADPRTAHIPLRREGFVYWGAAGQAGPTPVGKPALVGRQSTAINTATGAASTGQLFLVRALPAGCLLEAELRLSDELLQVVGEERLADLLTGPALLGSRRLSGTYGNVHCHLGRLSRVAAGPGARPWDWDEEGATTIWLTSDLILRSATLGAAGGITDLMKALEAEGAAVHLHQDRAAKPGARAGARYAAGVRHRRVDSWSAADHQPRPSRIAIQAGSVIRVRPADPGADAEVRRALSRIERNGLGQLKGQGFGRIAVGHPLLAQQSIAMRMADQAEFLKTGVGQ